MQARDRDAFELMLGAVAELLHRVPADPALGDVAMHVVGKAQVFIDSDAVAGRAGLADPACADGVRAFLRARFTAWPPLPPVGVEEVARRANLLIRKLGTLKVQRHAKKCKSLISLGKLNSLAILAFKDV